MLQKEEKDKSGEKKLVRRRTITDTEENILQRSCSETL